MKLKDAEERACEQIDSLGRPNELEDQSDDATFRRPRSVMGPTNERLSLKAAPRSRASGRCVLRAPGGPVDLDGHPAGGGSRVDQFECCVRAGVGEQPRALAD